MGKRRAPIFSGGGLPIPNLGKTTRGGNRETIAEMMRCSFHRDNLGDGETLHACKVTLQARYFASPATNCRPGRIGLNCHLPGRFLGEQLSTTLAILSGLLQPKKHRISAISSSSSISTPCMICSPQATNPPNRTNHPLPRWVLLDLSALRE